MPTCLRDLVGGNREERGRAEEISTPPHMGRPHRITGARAGISIITTLPVPQHPPFYPLALNKASGTPWTVPPLSHYLPRRSK